MRLGLIGLGRIGAFHAETLTRLTAVESLVVTDAVPQTAKRLADRLDVEVADSAAALLASGVDGVVIAAATDAHPELLLAAVEAGLPVFCEKPVARSAAEGVEVLRRVSGSGVQVQIGYPRRFDEGFMAARAAVASGELGWLHTVRSTTLDPAPPPPAYVAVSGGIFRDCSVHDFDAVRWVTGREVVEVYAAGGNRGADFFREAGDADTASAVLTLDDGTLAVVSNSRYNPRGYDVRLELHGSEDSIAVGLEDRLPLRSVEPGATFPAYSTARLLHRPLRGGLPRRTGRLHRGRRRAAYLSLHDRRRPGDRLDRRGLHPLARRAPAGPRGRGSHGRSTRMTGTPPLPLPLRIGVLGAARISELSIAGPARTAGHRLVAVAARDRSRAERFAALHGVERVLGSYEEVIADPEVEAVYNPLANALHAPWNLAAVRAGKHVLTEKPSASNAEEAREVRDAAAAAGVTVMEGFHYLYHPVTRRLHELLDSGELGELRAVEADMIMPAPDDTDPRWSYELAGGALMDLGCYSLHANRALAPWVEAAHRAWPRRAAGSGRGGRGSTRGWRPNSSSPAARRARPAATWTPTNCASPAVSWAPVARRPPPTSCSRTSTTASR